jgi:hypothetical protein
MWPLDFYYNVVQLKAGDLGDAKTTATGQTDDDAVPPVICRPASPGL